MCGGGNKLCYPLAAAHRYSRRAHNPTAIRGGDNILSEEALQSCHVRVLRGSDKGFQKAPLLVRTDGRAPAIRNVFTSTGNQLPGVGFLYLQDVGNLAIGVIESF